jgi:hypothetical protein
MLADRILRQQKGLGKETNTSNSKSGRTTYCTLDWLLARGHDNMAGMAFPEAGWRSQKREIDRDDG